MIEEVRLGRACDTLQRGLRKEIAAYQVALKKDSALIGELRRQAELEQGETEILTQSLANRAEQAKELRKELRRQKVRTVVVGALGVLAVLLAL